MSRVGQFIGGPWDGETVIGCDRQVIEMCSLVPEPNSVEPVVHVACHTYIRRVDYDGQIHYVYEALLR